MYALGFGALFGLIAVCHGFQELRRYFRSPAENVEKKSFLSKATACVQRLILRKLVYPSFLNRKAWTERWSRGDALILVFYFGANVTCLALSPDIATAGRRAGTLALVNMILLFAGPHLSFIADILNVSIRQYKRIHAAAGMVTLTLAAFHSVVGAIEGVRLRLSKPSELYALIVSYHLQSCSTFALTPRLVGHCTVMRPAHVLDATNVVIRTEPPNPPTPCICRSLCCLAP